MPNNLLDIAEKSAKGGTILLLSEASSTIILAIGSILIARFLGPEGYGIYSLTLVVPAIFSSFVSLGLDSAVIRFLAKLRMENKVRHSIMLLKNAIIFRSIIGFIMFLLCFFSSDMLASYLLNRPEAGLYLKITSLIILFQSLFNLLYSAYIGFDRYGGGAALKIIMSIVKSSLAPLLIILGLGIVGAVTGHTLSYIVSSTVGMILLYIYAYGKTKSNIGDLEETGSDFVGDLKLMINYGMPLYLASLMSLLIDQYRFILLAHNVSDLEIGNFQAAGNFVVLLAVISMPISTALFPAFSKLDPGSEEVKKAFQYSIKYTSMLVAPAAVFTIVMSRSLVELVYGSRFSQAPLYLSLYSIMYVYSILGSTVLASFFNGIGRTVTNLKATIIYVASFIPLSIPLTSQYGAEGLIISLLISYLLGNVYSVYVAVKRLRMPVFFKDSLKILLSSFIAALPIVPLSFGIPMPSYLCLPIAIVIYVLIYATILPLLKALKKIDIEILGMVLQSYNLIRPIINLIIKYESRLVERVERIKE